MKRWLFNIAAAVPLLLCIATSALWVRSYFVFEQIGHYNVTTWWMLESSLGQLSYGGNQGQITYYRESGRVTQPLWWWDRLDAADVTGQSRTGFQYERGGRYNTTLAAPYWFVIMLTALPAVLWIALRRLAQNHRAHRIAAGRCPTCGYDMRASPERCPECGVLAAVAKS